MCYYYRKIEITTIKKKYFHIPFPFFKIGIPKLYEEQKT